MLKSHMAPPCGAVGVKLQLSVLGLDGLCFFQNMFEEPHQSFTPWNSCTISSLSSMLRTTGLCVSLTLMTSPLSLVAFWEECSLR
ncbi:hypothetical protein VIGAN_11032900 [Vigna angularis var. angularis]|uniref:Uncharacterized protein n=1 Tax=Vigna angularis var. angularis TaxID=157739 RepID=A0A0S3T7F9_PHAAN|nr:hypothetical protein VIGAN_11032900 [Vigna angularis var. angularis]